MKVPQKEKLVLACDLNGHVGESRIGFERRHGGCTVGERNEGGENILHLAQTSDLAIVSAFYSKQREHLLTYKSRGNATVIDCIMVRRENLRKLKNCKVIPEESCATQHRKRMGLKSAERKPNTYKQQRTLIRLGRRYTWIHKWSTCQQSIPSNILDQR